MTATTDTKWVVKGRWKWKPWWLFAAGWDVNAALTNGSWGWTLFFAVLGAYMLKPERADQ